MPDFFPCFAKLAEEPPDTPPHVCSFPRVPVAGDSITLPDGRMCQVVQVVMHSHSLQPTTIFVRLS